jgi:transcriptional regulator with XRE-family HTH domain
MTEQTPERYAELASFGEELRKEREVRGISLKEISDATKISKRFLEAIERNDHKTLPAPVFTRGFVREYARYLGLNSEEIVSRYNYAAAGDDRIERSTHLDRLVHPPIEEPVVPVLKKQGIPPPYARVDRNIYLLVLIVAALGGITWYALRHKGVARIDNDARPETATIASAPPARAATPETTPAVDPDLLHLTVEAIDDSWVSLEADGKSVFNDEMKKGMKRNFDARESFRFKTIGNAAGINLTLNDTRLPSLGGEGDVIRNRVFDRGSLQEIITNSPRSDT